MQADVIVLSPFSMLTAPNSRIKTVWVCSVFYLALNWHNDLCTTASTKSLFDRPIIRTFSIFTLQATYQSTLVFRFYTMAGRQCCVPMSALDDQLVPDLVPGTFRLFL